MWRLIVLVVAIGAFHALTLREGHDWGDDFAMYIAHAKNLVEGRPYADTGYIDNPATPLYAPVAYPPVFPLLLTPVYFARGLDLRSMKLVVVLFLVLALATTARLFREDLSPPSLLLLLATLGLNPYLWIVKDHVIADLPFLFFALASLLLMHRSAARPATSPGPAIGRGVLIGLVAYLAYGTRSLGLVLLPCLVVHDLVVQRRIRRETAVALVVFAVAAALQIAVAPAGSGASHVPWFSVAPWELARQAVRYGRSLRLFWDNGHSLVLTGGVIAGTALLALAGLAARLRRRVTVFEIFVLLYPLPILSFMGFQGMRYLIPLMPFYLFYALWAIERLRVSRPAWARLVLVAWVAVIGLTYGLRYPGMSWGALREGVGAPTSIELFDYISTQTEPTAVFVFRRPRALALFGERRAATYSREPESDDDIWSFLTRIHATHLVVQRLEIPHWKSFVVRHHQALEITFSNESFTVYRIARPP